MKRRILIILIIVAAIGVGSMLAHYASRTSTGVTTSSLGMGGPEEYFPPTLPLLPEPAPAVTDAGPAGPAIGPTVEMRIQRGQVFYEALADLDVPHEDIMALVKAVGSFRNLRAVRAGDRFQVEMSVRGDLAAFGFDLDLESWVRYTRREDGSFVQEMGAYPVEHRTVGVTGVIESSLYESLQACGAPLNLAAKMNDILGWDIDFSRDPRRGDVFRIVFEEIHKDGEFVRTGPILACSYDSRNRDRAAYRYTLRDGKTGYYDPEGKNLQKQLMRAPVNYSRISSSFSYSRMHPVLHRRMPHLGVDYAAPVGTPVWAAGDGVIVAFGRKKGNGRYVHIRHTNRQYETYYLHFSRFAKGLKKGTKVRQGDVIGYVGASGYATGPHLDFRVKKGGTFVNPRTLKLPPAAPVPANEEPSFLALRFGYDTALAELSGQETRPAAITALNEAGPPWWDAKQCARMAVPATLRAAD